MTVLSHCHQGTVFSTIAPAAGVLIGSTAGLSGFLSCDGGDIGLLGKGGALMATMIKSSRTLRLLIKGSLHPLPRSVVFWVFSELGPLHPLLRSVVFWVFFEVGPLHPLPRSVAFWDSSAKHRPQTWASERKLNQMLWQHLI